MDRLMIRYKVKPEQLERNLHLVTRSSRS